MDKTTFLLLVGTFMFIPGAVFETMTHIKIIGAISVCFSMLCFGILFLIKSYDVFRQLVFEKEIK